MAHDVLEGYRLSSQQQALLPLQREGPQLRSQFMLAIDGRCRTEALSSALEHVVNRHEILRTALRSPSGVDLTLQIIADAAGVTLDRSDLSRLDPGARERRLEDAFVDELERGFDLEEPSLVRAQLFTRSPTRHDLLVSFPAIAADAPSLGSFVSQLVEAYEAHCSGRTPPTRDVVQYADFAQWQIELLESDEGREGAAYWARTAREHGAAPRLPFEKAPAGARVRHAVRLEDPSALSRIESLARATGAPPTIALLACWQTLLWRLADKPQSIAVDVRFDGREHDDLRNAVGCFSAYIPVLLDCERRRSFGELVARCHELVSDAERWQACFPSATWRSGLGADVQRLAFCHEEWPRPQQAVDALFTLTRLHSYSAPVKLELAALRTPTGQDLELRYDPAVYPERTVATLREGLGALLESAAADLDSPPGKLALLGERARRDVLRRWNPPAPQGDEDRCVHRLVEEQARRTPDAVAVAFEDQRLTYRQLDEGANQLARHLQQLGAGPDVVVGLLAERSTKLVLALLAVLKAGAAYLPVDPALPRARIAAFLTESRTDLIVTESHQVDALPDAGGRIVSLDADWPQIAALSSRPVDHQPASSDLAYVIFTSGSTGTPKGVAVEHRQLVGYVGAVVERLDLSGMTSYASVSTIGADLGNTAIFPSLCTGAELHLISQERASDAVAFAEYLTANPVDCLKITPSHLAALVAAADRPEWILPRKRLVLGGELLTWGMMRVFRSHAAPGCRLFNHYGPTEATVGAAACEISEEPREELSASLPVGQPLAGSQIYLLDEYLEPVPVGMAGELYIGGAGLARGYINRPDLTAERFVPDPFSEPGGRLYRTGDVARRLPDGAIEILGRNDRQVKLRGFRVELGEIEAALRDHPAVRESVAVIRGESGAQQLVAYVVQANGQASIEALSSYVKDRLPEFMVPAHIVPLDELPLTGNGKVDHRSLPAPEHVASIGGSAYVAPRTPTEEILTGVFELMLGLERVGVHDDFFEIGGHSLLATRLLSRSRAVFKVGVSLRNVFEAPTAAGIGAIIDSALTSAPEDASPAAPPDTSSPQPLPLSAIAPANAIALRLRGRLDVAALEAALGELVRRHDILRMDGAPGQVVAEPTPFRVPIEDHAAGEASSAEDARTWAQALAREPFDRSGGPPIRARLLRASDEDHALVLAVDRRISDAWSMRILAHELGTLYGSLRVGGASPLEEPAPQYADVAAEPAGSPRERDDAGDGGACRRHHLALSKETTFELRQLAKQNAVTLPMLLLATLGAAVRLRTGRTEVALASPVSGRVEGAHEVVGPCATTVLACPELSRDPTFVELLDELRGLVLEAHARRRAVVGEATQEALTVLLVYQDAPAEVSFGDLTAEPVDIGLRPTELAGQGADLTARIDKTDHGLDGEVEFDPRDLDEAVVAGIVSEWHTLCAGLQGALERPLSSLADSRTEARL